eukprot:6177379-Pleurochrysis_carterae.AAC.2
MPVAQRVARISQPRLRQQVSPASPTRVETRQASNKCVHKNCGMRRASSSVALEAAYAMQFRVCCDSRVHSRP